MQCPALTQAQVAEFLERGILVVPNVLSEAEIAEARQGFHDDLQSRGVNCDELSCSQSISSLSQLSSTNGAGGILDMFYSPWKLKINENESIFAIMKDLWRCTIASSNTDYAHPFGTIDTDKGFMYIDRVCFRLPEDLLGTGKKRAQRSLTPHLDCCPYELFQGSKWKPIQCFVALTDTVNKNEGGFEAVPGHHIGFDAWAQRRPPSSSVPKGQKSYNGVPCVGQFTPIRPVEDKDVMDKFQHIPCRAGDLVLWDYRIPHANAAHNNTNHAREVVYLGFLPEIDLNKKYAETQLELYRQGNVPRDQWHNCNEKQDNSYEFSEIGRKLMTVDPW